MGFYIETPGQVIDKTKRLVKDYGAGIVNPPSSFDQVPEDKALICVVTNPFFEAAGYCYDEREFAVFSNIRDDRPKTWLLMDKKLAEKLSGYGD